LPYSDIQPAHDAESLRRGDALGNELFRYRRKIIEDTLAALRVKHGRETLGFAHGSLIRAQEQRGQLDEVGVGKEKTV